MADGFYINLYGIQALCELQEAGRLSLSAFAVGMALCRYMDRDGSCWPSREALGRRAGISRVDTVTKAIKDLVDAGFIVVKKGQRFNHYQLCAYDQLQSIPVDAENASTEESCRHEKRVSRNDSADAESASAQNPADAFSACSVDAENGCSLYIMNEYKNEYTGQCVSNKPASPVTAPATANTPVARTRRKRTEPTDSPTWREWVTACREAGRNTPAPSNGALKAARTLADWVPDLIEQCRIMKTFLALDDEWVRRQGFQLSILVNHRFEACRQRVAKTGTVGGDLSDLLYKTGRVEAAHGEDIARRYDAKARELKSTAAADEWLKGELVCLRA
ncbi:MAG: helix-turn-helix domain-containing protein [Planctomycetaceae bacterium]|nr:helix-turn-helix domain-containing protein [Planctomycetaceae bacterium]